MKLIYCLLFSITFYSNSSHRLLLGQDKVVNESDSSWYKSFPTLGLISDKSLFDNDYHFLPHRFLLNELAPLQGKNITVGVIDTPSDKNSAIAHSKIITHLIKEIAPEVTIKVISAFDAQGKGCMSAQIKALFIALEYKITLINMSYKIADFIDTKSSTCELFEYMLDLIPYSIAASGNDSNYCLEAYPARIKTVTFDVGSFERNLKCGSCPISPFSQYSIEAKQCSGPKSVSPGVYSIKWDENKKNIPVQGTSFACALMSGCIALVLAEFSDTNDFSREQILKVCYGSHIKLHDTAEWLEKTVLGVFDVRTALFTFHVLKQIKKNKNIWSLYSFETWCTAIHTLLFGMPGDDEATESINDFLFKKNFMQFYSGRRKVSKKEKLIIEPHYNNLQSALNWCIDSLMYAAQNQSKKPYGISDSLIEKLQRIFKAPHNTHADFGSGGLTSFNKVKNTSRPTQPLSKRAIGYLGNTDSERLQNLEIPYKVYWSNQSQMLKSR